MQLALLMLPLLAVWYSAEHKCSGSMQLALLMLPLLAVWYSAEHKFSGSMQLALLMLPLLAVWYSAEHKFSGSMQPLHFLCFANVFYNNLLITIYHIIFNIFSLYYGIKYG